MRGFFFMSGRLLFLGLVLALLNVQAFAQIGLVLQLPPTANIDNVAAHAGGVVVDAIPEAGLFLLSVSSVPQNLSDSDRVWAEVNQGTTLPSAPPALYFSVPPTTPADWFKTQPAFGLINLSGATTCSTGSGVIVADIDSKVDCSHPALIGHCMIGNDFVVGAPSGLATQNDSSASYLDDSSASYLDDSSASYLDDSSASYLDDSSASYLDGHKAQIHGTFTAGIIRVVAPGAIIMPLRAFADDGSSNCFTIAKAIHYAVRNGAQVINMSFGLETACKAISTAITYALGRNVTIPASAGNKNSSVPQFPASLPGVLATAATTIRDVKASFSNYGPNIFIAAPGVHIISAVPDNHYGIMSGTSFSAPIIAATVARLLAEGVTGTGVASRIASGASNIDLQNPSYIRLLGAGRVNIRNSICR